MAIVKHFTDTIREAKCFIDSVNYMAAVVDNNIQNPIMRTMHIRKPHQR